ncbi:MAG: HAMP domain-containing protein [Actinobacteria bacterium]|nr:HAMP domain-containing protein [Actinomycetota bacterium]
MTANLAGALVMFVVFGMIGPGRDLTGDRLGELTAVFVGFMAMVVPPLVVILTRVNNPLREAVARGEPLVGPIRRLALANPWLNAVGSLGGWLLAAVVFPIYSGLRLDNGALEVAILAVGLVLAGLATMAMVYLLTERASRPLVARAFHHEPPDRVRGVAVAPRLLLSWGLGAAVPSLLIGIALLDPEADVTGLRRVGLVLVAASLVTGWAVMVRAARSVADPLQTVRAAMGRVREGDLGVTVEVDDATEVGLLQAGFNDMVAGLRERVRLRDLGVVEAEGGLVNKFEGDAALCIFGAPVRHEDHAARALRAARSLRARVEELRGRHPQLDAGIGVSTGEVVAGNVGSRQRLEYTVIGDPVNEAARLTDEAKVRPARVLASEATVTASEEEAEAWKPVAVLELRGRSAPTRAFEPV